MRSKLREITGDIKLKTNHSTYTWKRLENTVQEYPKSKNYFFLSTISFPLTLIHIFFCLRKSKFLESFLHNCVLYSTKHQLDIFSIWHEKENKKTSLDTCGTCEMWINNFFRIRIEVDKHSKYKFSSCYSVFLRTWNWKLVGNVTSIYKIYTIHLKIQY